MKGQYNGVPPLHLLITGPTQEAVDMAQVFLTLFISRRPNGIRTNCRPSLQEVLKNLLLDPSRFLSRAKL